MTTNFDNRSRFLLCAVDGCDEHTASYQDLNTTDPIRYRVPLCDVHKAKRDEGEAQLLAPSRVQWLLLGNGPTLVEQLKTDMDVVKTDVTALKARPVATK